MVKKASKAARKAATNGARRTDVGSMAERRAHKLEKRKKEKTYKAEMWAEPAPSHLVAKLDIPKVKSKYQSYFEFTDNTEKKKKKLEFKITDNPKPPPGFIFVPIGDPALTNACKELSREKDAMIFIVSNHKEEHFKISEHIHRTGYHFREVIVEEAREIVGETIISRPGIPPGFVEPIPESQEEINNQADAAMRDLFPRIPNTDRTMIIEHAFKKGALFHGEPTVGLQSNIPLSRRVQLAVLAHIRHTHTRYDKLLRETTWMNARKAVEPVCLDVLVKWRGDEETGRDQMDEILREVVIITDSEEEDDSSDEDSSDEDGEVTSASSAEGLPEPTPRNQQRTIQLPNQARPASRISQAVRETAGTVPKMSARTGGMAKAQGPRDKKAQRGFKRYQAAWDEALHRKQDPPIAGRPTQAGTPSADMVIRRSLSAANAPIHNMSQPPLNGESRLHVSGLDYNGESSGQHLGQPIDRTRSGQYYSQTRPAPPNLIRRDDVTVRTLSERSAYYQAAQPRFGSPSSHIRDSRPPQVVRASPTRHGFQDMLLPSIETASSDVPSTRVDVRFSVNHGWEKVPYPRRVIQHGKTPPVSRQVIVINDDSPQPKRRRVVHEDDAAAPRLFPSHDQNHYVQPQHFESPLMSASSVQPGTFPRHRPRVPSQFTQGLFKNTQPPWMGSPEEERLPVYDAPESGFFAIHPNQLGRPDIGYVPTHGGESRMIRQLGLPKPPHENIHGNLYHTRSVNEYQREHVMKAEPDHGFRQAAPEHGPGDDFQSHSSSKFPVQSKISRSYDTGPLPAVADQDFIHSFSQSRLDGPSIRPSDGFTIISERSHQSSTNQGIHPQGYDDHSPRSFAAAPSVGASSPVHYVKRPTQYREATRQPVREQQRPQRFAPVDRPALMLRDQQMPPSVVEQPIYVRTVEPRRQVVIID